MKQLLLGMLLCMLSVSCFAGQSKAEEYYKKGTDSFSSKNYTAAISYYTKAIALAPGIGLYYMARALCYFAMNNTTSMMNDIIIAAQYGNPDVTELIKTVRADFRSIESL
jgi:tetratricopeptide (TPR) repeat protein